MGQNISNHASDKGLISRTYGKLLKLNHTKPSSRMGKGFEQTFLHEDIKKAKKHMKRCSSSLIMQIKTKMRYHLIPIRMTIFFSAK